MRLPCATAPTYSFVAKHLNLTLLAPDIVAAILDDALPDGVRLSTLPINPPVTCAESGPHSARPLRRLGQRRSIRIREREVPAVVEGLRHSLR